MPSISQSWFGSVCNLLSTFGNISSLTFPDGGGYTGGQGNYDFSEMVTTNGNGFIYVGIQYRLGAFGFLSSEDIHENGVPNAGLHDMQYALRWVQDQIHKVGGDPKRVTIAGESAGGGGVMHMTIANGGTDGTKYFTNAIVASPFLPMQWNYNDPVPTLSYNNFVELAGCSGQTNEFACLQAADTLTLQNASAIQSGSVEFGYYGFVPVTDGKFIQNRPSVQLLSGRVNGLRLLSGVSIPPEIQYQN
jgi:carboxylesterase type B